MAPASVAISLSFRFLPPRPYRGRVSVPRPIRASSDTSGVASGERKAGTLERRVGDLRALVASVPPAVDSIRKNIGLNFVVGFCFGIAFLAAVARQIIIRTREHDNRGSVADLVRRGQLKSGQRGIAKPRVYDDPFNNPLVKIDEGTSTAQMFGKEYRLAPVRLTKEQQAMHQERRSRTYQWKRPTVFLKEGDSLPPDVDPDTVRWIPVNHPFAAASSEVDEETAKQNVYQKDGVPSRVKAEHEALQTRLEASNDVTKFSSGPRRLSGESSGNLQHSESGMVKNQNDQPTFESEKHSSDNNSQSKSGKVPCCPPGMKGGFLHRLLVSKLCFGLVVLLIVPIVVLLLEGAPVLTIFNTTPEQLKVFTQDFLQQQEQEHLGDNVSALVKPAGPAYKNHTQKDCNYAKGKWVADEKRPLYSGNECKQWLSKMWACRMMQRTDFSYESYRWQPHGCEMPEFSGPNFLKRMRHKTLAFVGDSLGRQQFQSMMCIATGGKYSTDVEDVGWKYGLVKAPGALRPDGWAYRFPGTNTTILFYWSASLSELEPLNTMNSVTSYSLHLDRPVTFLKKYLHSFDVLVLNTGHHWNRGKFNGNHWELYADGKPVGKGGIVDLNRAKNLTLHSIARWVDSELVRRPQMKVFLRTMSPRHFVNGDWNTGGSCGNTIPLSNGSEVLQDHSSDLPAEHAVNGTRVKLLDITAISQLRDEGHISNYSLKASTGIHDCLHWCLPGIPDMWNELLFAQI